MVESEQGRDCICRFVGGATHSRLGAWRGVACSSQGLEGSCLQLPRGVWPFMALGIASNGPPRILVPPGL